MLYIYILRRLQEGEKAFKILLKLIASHKNNRLPLAFCSIMEDTKSIKPELSVRRDHPSNWIIPSRFIFSYEF